MFHLMSTDENQTLQLYISAPGPPRSIKVVVDSQDAVVVSWLPPAQPNGVIVQYNIYVRSVAVAYH